MNINTLLKLITCPACSSSLIKKTKKLICTNCQKKYPLIHGIPVLIDKTGFDSQEINQMKWFNKHYSLFKDEYFLENWRHSMIKRVFQNYLLKNSKYYLDIGCGATGYTVIEAAKKGLISIGVDISLEAMLKAQTLAKKQKVFQNTAFIVTSAQSLPFKKNTFDYISAISLLEHLQDDSSTIKQISQILKDKKFLYICVPNSYKHIWFFLWPFYFYNDIKIGHKRHYSIEKLSFLLNSYGFKLNKHFYNGHLIKFLQLFLEKINLINHKFWWSIEKSDINKIPSGVQLNAVFQKQ